MKRHPFTLEERPCWYCALRVPWERHQFQLEPPNFVLSDRVHRCAEWPAWVEPPKGARGWFPPGHPLAKEGT